MNYINKTFCRNINCKNYNVDFKRRCTLYFNLPNKINKCSIRKTESKQIRKKYLQQYIKSKKFKNYQKNWTIENIKHIQQYHKNYYLKHKK